MASPRPSAAHASVLFARIPAFGQQPVAEQARLKALVEARVKASLSPFRDEERIVLDGSDGVAVVVLANPAAALELARQASGDDGPHLTIGLTHGPVRISSDGAQTMVYGDGLVAAEAISAFARPGAIAVSREFREALARTAPGAARHLPTSYATVEAGERSFELLHVDEASLAAGKRRFLAMTAAACVALIALGGIVRWTSSGEAPPPKPGTVVFDIKPSGEIFVNGLQKGSSPPLKSIQLPAGTHTIEIRHERFPPLVTVLAVASGEELSVAHTFASPKARPKAQEKGFWRSLTDKLKP